MSVVPSLKILVVDDHNLFRQGLRSLLEIRFGQGNVATAENGEEALQLIEQNPPDILLTDIDMPILDGFALTEQVKRTHPLIHIIALSMHHRPDYARRMLEAGAQGFLIKDAAVDELALAIEAVCKGERFISYQLANQLLQPEEQPAQPLTRREKQILALICDGLSNKDIADSLSISVRTVESHRANLLEKTNSSGVAGLIRYALKEGISNI